MKKKGGKQKSAGLIRLIGTFRLVKGVLLLAAGFGLLKFLHGGLAEQVESWLRQWHADPDNHYFKSVVSKISHLNGRSTALMAAGTLFYAGLFLTEGVGLLLRKRWAEFLTVIATASFIPLEIYELVSHFTAMKVVVIVVNVAIVVYLIWRLKTER